MKKIVFVNKTLLMGGIEKSLEFLVKDLRKYFDIEIIYLTNENLDEMIVNKLKKYVKVSCIDEYENIECDICIWCTLYFEYEHVKKIIKAKKSYAWVHSMPRAFENCLLDNEEFVKDIDKFICVSNSVKDILNVNKPSIVIHNFIDDEINVLSNIENPYKSYPDKLKLVTVSRISRGKGFERIKIMTDEFEKMKIDYIWLVVGNGRSMECEIKSWFQNNSNIVFVGKKANPYPYIKNADFLIQLSDDESWGIVISEALALHTPVVVTDFPSSKEQVQDGFNGIIVDRNKKSYIDYILRMISENDKFNENIEKYEYKNEFKNWLEELYF